MLTNGTTLSRTVVRDAYRRHLVTAITNSVDDVAVNPLAYNYDLLNRVVVRNTDTFGYNARSEVTSAAILSNAYTYAYDDIGNHTASSVDSAATTYTANALNQYSTISVPSVDNPSYDLDGNMLTNGVWSYAYDAESRLTAAYSNNVCVVSNAYDYMSRRVLKISHGGTETRRFVYDGWNLAQEAVTTASGTTTNFFVWGRDISGTMQGAGGVGGLLSVRQGNAWYFPLYDNNGNITAYVDETGAIVAPYAYDAFGATIAASGSMCDIFRHRFSTKYYDAETGLYYYGYRFYSPVFHRWLNRDPIEEQGGLNLYGFCGNNGVNAVDMLGMAKFYVYLVGDSLTHAYVGEEPENGRSLDFSGYKNFLVKRLKAKYPQHSFDVDGVGKSGITIGRLSVEHDANHSYRFKNCIGYIVPFLLGMNDMAGGNRTVAGDIENKIMSTTFPQWLKSRNTIAYDFQNQFGRTLFLSMTIPSVYENKSNKQAVWRRNYSISQMNDKILANGLPNTERFSHETLQLGTIRNTSYKDINYKMYELGDVMRATRNGGLEIDNIHYNDAGNTAIADRVLGVVAKWIDSNFR